MSIIVNSRISFVFALMKCCFAAFGEQNKIDNDSRCQQVYKSIKIRRVCSKRGENAPLFSVKKHFFYKKMHFFRKIFGHVHFLLYLCTAFPATCKKAWQKSEKKDPPL